MLSFRNFTVAKKIMVKKGRRLKTFVGIFSVPKFRNFSKQGIVWCFIKFGHRKSFLLKRLGENEDFLSK